MTDTALTTIAKEFIEKGKAATREGSILKTRPMDDELEKELIAAISESIRASRSFKDGLPWWWLENNDGLKVAEFGCGPTSEVNAQYFGFAAYHGYKIAEGFLALQAECEKEKGWKETFMDLVEGETKLNERWQAEHHEISKRCQALQAENDRLKEALTDICEQLAPGTDWGSSMCDTINDIARAALKPQGTGEAEVLCRHGKNEVRDGYCGLCEYAPDGGKG